MCSLLYSTVDLCVVSFIFSSLALLVPIHEKCTTCTEKVSEQDYTSQAVARDNRLLSTHHNGCAVPDTEYLINRSGLLSGLLYIGMAQGCIEEGGEGSTTIRRGKTWASSFLGLVETNKPVKLFYTVDQTGRLHSQT